MTSAHDLTNKTCKPCEGGTAPLTKAEVDSLIKQLIDWQHSDNLISKKFGFKNYHQTMAFVNAVAWVSHRENHHPDLIVTYNSCQISYTTHAIQGLSENDFICAAKVDALLKI